MKKLIFAIIALLPISCTNEFKLNKPVETSTVTLDYRLPISSFYEKILQEDFIEPEFSLTLTPVGSGTPLIIKGKWGDSFTIPSGYYYIQGSSITTETTFIKSRCSIAIDEFREIKNGHITLNATYNSFLLYTPKNDLKKVTNYYGCNEEFYEYKDYYYAFSDKLYPKGNKDNCIRLYNEDETFTSVSTYPLPFEVGKCYFGSTKFGFYILK